MLKLLGFILLLALAGLGIAHYIRRSIRESQEALKHVDKSKLKDLSDDEWDDDRR